MSDPTATEKIVNNKLLTVLARGSMILAAPLMAGLITTVGTYFSGQAEAMSVMQSVQVIHGREIALLQQHSQSGDRQRDQDQLETLARLDRMQDVLVQLSNSVAGLTAVIESDRRATTR